MARHKLSAYVSKMLAVAAVASLVLTSVGLSPQTGAGAAAMSTAPGMARTGPNAAPASDTEQPTNPAFRALDEKIQDAMARYHVPGVGVGVLYNGQEYVRGYGVTNVDDAEPVDGDTLFRIGSTTKTFTGTTIMRLVEQGLLDLDAPVRSYLPELQLGDESVAARVTVRQLLNHSAGWLGEYYEDTGRGNDALEKYVAGMRQLPQLTPLGQVFAYNNAAVVLAGRVIEAVTGKPYEEAVQELVLDPLGLTHTGFFTDRLVGYRMAASHNVVDGRPMLQPAFWPVPRSMHPTGGLISSARDQLRYARFHMGDGTAPDGQVLLSPQSLTAMRSNPGPGGTIGFELDGFGVNWMLRRTAEGVPVVEHGGTWLGQLSGFMFVPDRGFAITVLTNSEGGHELIAELFTDDWVLRQFAGLSNPPAVPVMRATEDLAAYAGRYVGRMVSPPGSAGEELETIMELSAADGGLRATIADTDEPEEYQLRFYRDDYVVVQSDDDVVNGSRADFVRDPDGRVAWFRFGGRLYAHQA